jgi:hypothetical protein
MYKAREVFRNNATANASFGSRDALASMVAGAISAATMNITEYVTEENSYIQNWKQNITSARNTFVAIRGVESALLFLGGIGCGVFGPAGCIGSNIGSQALQWGLEYPTYKTSEEMDDLIRNEYNRHGDSYLTEKGKQVKELTKFLRTIVAMNETHIAPLVYLSGVFTSYVALTVASNATKTAADVHSDLNGILGGDDLDADVKTLAGMLIGDTPPADVLDSFSYLIWIRILPGIAAILPSLILVWKIIGVFKQHSRNAAELAKLLGMNIGQDPDYELQMANKFLDERKELIRKLERKSKDLLTFDDINELGLEYTDKRLIKVYDEHSKLTKYKFRTQIEKDMFLELAIHGDSETLDMNTVACNLTPLEELEARVKNIKRIQELKPLVENKPTLNKMIAEEKWYKNGAKVMLVFSIITAAAGGIITARAVKQINEFIDSVVSSRTSSLETTAGVLGAWQELHKPI